MNKRKVKKLEKEYKAFNLEVIKVRKKIKKKIFDEMNK